MVGKWMLLKFGCGFPVVIPAFAKSAMVFPESRMRITAPRMSGFFEETGEDWRWMWWGPTVLGTRTPVC